ncbi:MAG: hypothetical protein U0Q18_24990 [Bryobacteraceae bacterium]
MRTRDAFFSVSLMLFSSYPLWPQVGMENNVRPSPYPATWPAGPRRDSLPSWAEPGSIRFARWDGGRIETAKAMLSGWPGFNPPDPNRVDTMTNWYRPDTVRFLREAGINMIWVTFSNGFSNQTEAAHQQQVRKYIDECHRSGIHVMAYESIANLFWEDMFENVPESRNWPFIGEDGKPTPYGAGDYTKMGRVTRYMADLRKPEWRAYLRGRIDLALDAGADGVIYDNNFSNYLLPTYREIYEYGASRKRDFLLMGNFHEDTYVYNRLLNCITTEDGVEPGVYAEAHVGALHEGRDRASLRPVDGGFLVNNIGLFRIHQALAEGWKPVMIEDGHREAGVRETTPMSPERHKLALAEAKMFGLSMELFVEGSFAHGLATGDPATRRIWDAIGNYNRFFSDNQEYFTRSKPVAPIAIILDDRSSDVVLLNALAARNVVYDVLYEHDLTADRLSRYDVAALLTTEAVRNRALDALEAFVKRGGKLFAAGSAASVDENGQRRSRPALFSQGIYYEKLPEPDSLAKALTEAAPSRLTVNAPPGVLYQTAMQTEDGKPRLLVHLLNYTPHPVSRIRIKLESQAATARLLTPDGSRQPVRVSTAGGNRLELEIPELTTYSLLIIE